MAEQHNVRVGLHVLAVILIGASAVTASFAKPAHWRTHLRAHHRTQSGRIGQPAKTATPFNHERADGKDHPGNQPVSKTGDESAPVQGHASPNDRPVAAPKGARTDAKGAEHAQDDNAHDARGIPPTGAPSTPESQMKQLGPIDTRITVLPSGHSDKTQQQKAKTKFKLPVPGNGHGNQKQARKAAEDVAPNAIGIAGAAHRDSRHDDKPGNLHLAVGDRGAPSSAIVKTRAGVSIRPNPTLAGPRTPPVAVSRGAINGSGVLRHGFAPAAVGGPPRIVAGIRGTMFRPKR